ncbi:hypothetical protein P3T76_013531 [Phytophthora citrophthora]|uniref:Uncharacterized protein n=1 Tax=Phytophthora citrophthora TaxID=4793 RepID=A0AAD9G3U3_9STRA|nr:hypothetical protein P3T76_013531 [Phytophthora citrophthora]
MAPPSTKNNLLQKLTPTPFMRDYLKWFIVQAFKILGVVFTVHLLNVFVAIAGVICVAFLLAGMALMPIWIVVASVLDVVQQIKINRRFYTCLTVLYLCLLPLNNWYITLGPWIIIAAGALAVGLFFLSAVAMKFLVKIDVISANFAAFNDSNVRDPDEYQDWLKLSEPTCSSRIAPHTRMTRCLWLAFASFALFKLFAGMVSVAVLCFSVVIPALQLFGASDALEHHIWCQRSFLKSVIKAKRRYGT